MDDNIEQTKRYIGDAAHEPRINAAPTTSLHVTTRLSFNTHTANTEANTGSKEYHKVISLEVSTVSSDMLGGGQLNNQPPKHLNIVTIFYSLFIKLFVLIKLYFYPISMLFIHLNSHLSENWTVRTMVLHCPQLDPETLIQDS